MGKAYIEVGIYILRKAGTVKALGRCAAVNIGRAEQRCRVIDDLLAGGRGRCCGSSCRGRTIRGGGDNILNDLDIIGMDVSLIGR